MNIFHLLDKSARRHPDRGAVYSGSRPILSYRELRSRALQRGGGLRRSLGARDRVAIVARNCVQYPEAMFAVWAAGCVAVPLNCKLHEREVADIVADAGARLVFVSPDLEGAVRSSCPGSRVVALGGREYEDLACGEAPPACEVAPEDLAWLFYTSGTTGRSKGAMLSHRNLLAMTIAHLADFEDLSAWHNIIHAAPMSHGSGLYMLPYVARGAGNIICESPSFDASEVLRLSSAHEGCGIFMAPTMVQRLRVAAEKSGVAGNLRTILYGGAPMYVEELRRALALFGPIFIQLYGQGEAPVTITGLRREDHVDAGEAVLGSVGWPRSGVEVAVVDPDGDPLPSGEIGEVVCRGDVIMGGYWSNPAASAEALRRGWLWTGDMGYLDEHGKLTLRDRSKDVVISGGTNIYPREVEEALLTHPSVAEICVVGQPDAEWGEIVVACIVPSQGERPAEAELEAHCLSRIARFKRPRRYLFLEALPKSSYGKVLKREIIASLQNPARDCPW